jgi:hypothetical protein
MAECALEAFCEVVDHVYARIDAFHSHKVSVYPLAKRKGLDIHMPSAWSWLLSVSHSCRSAVPS